MGRYGMRGHKPVATMSMVLFVMCGAPLWGVHARTSSEIAAIKQKGTLEVAVYSGDYYPFIFWRDGKPLGHDVDLVKGIAKELGVKPVFNNEAKTFSTLIDLVEAHKVDMAASAISYSPQRATRILYTDPYATLYFGLLVNRLKIKHIKGVMDVLNAKTKTISVLGNSSHAEMVAGFFPQASYIYNDQTDLSIKAVVQGKAEAYFGDEVLIRDYQLRNPGDSLRLKPVKISESRDYFALVLPWNHEHLRQWINWHIKTKVERVEIDELFKKYEEVRK